MSANEPHRIRVVVIGDTESGRASVIGRFVESSVGTETLESWRGKSTAVAGSRAAAGATDWVLRDLQFAREAGSSVPLSLVLPGVENTRFDVVDVCGHHSFTTGLLTGSVEADVAVCVISSKADEFERAWGDADDPVSFGCDENVTAAVSVAGTGSGGASTDTKSQPSSPVQSTPPVKSVGPTRHQLQVMYSLGITQLIVCINKLDSVSLSADFESRYAQIQSRVTRFLQTVGFTSAEAGVTSVKRKMSGPVSVASQLMARPPTVHFVGVSASTGMNLQIVKAKTKPATTGAAGVGSGGAVSGVSHSLQWALSQMKPAISVHDRKSQPLRIPIQNVYKIGGIGTVPTGRVECGVLAPPVWAQCAPAKTCAQLIPPQATSTYNTGIGRGTSGGGDGPTCLHFEVRSVETHLDDLVAEPDVIPGFNIKGVHHLQIDCGAVCVSRDPPPHLTPGQIGWCELVPSQPICVEPFVVYPRLGRFAVRDRDTPDSSSTATATASACVLNGHTTAVGVITSVARITGTGQTVHFPSHVFPRSPNENAKHYPLTTPVKSAALNAAGASASAAVNK